MKYSITQLFSVTCHIALQTVICHPTQVNALCLNPSHTGWYSIYLSWRDGRLSWVDSIAPRPQVKPATFRSRLWRRTAAPPGQAIYWSVKHVHTELTFFTGVAADGVRWDVDGLWAFSSPFSREHSCSLADSSFSTLAVNFTAMSIWWVIAGIEGTRGAVFKNALAPSRCCAISVIWSYICKIHTNWREENSSYKRKTKLGMISVYGRTL